MDGNIFDDISNAVAEAERTQLAVNKQCTAMAKLLVGRLRHVETGTWAYTLKNLKRELAAFDSRANSWKEMP